MKITSIPWRGIDCLAMGNSLGRSVLMRGHHAAPHELSTPSLRAAPLESPPKKSKSVPLDFPDFALNPFSVKAFNAAYYAAHPSQTSVVDFDSFFIRSTRLKTGIAFTERADLFSIKLRCRTKPAAKV